MRTGTGAALNMSRGKSETAGHINRYSGRSESGLNVIFDVENGITCHMLVNDEISARTQG
jgi:hypothetical protein